MARKYSRADYLALKRSQIPASLAQIKGMRFDSEEDASVFFARELDHVKSKTYDKLYPQFTVLNNIPRTSDANPAPRPSPSTATTRRALRRSSPTTPPTCPALM